MVIELTGPESSGCCVFTQGIQPCDNNIPYGGEDDVDDIVAGPNSKVSGLVVLSE